MHLLQVWTSDLSFAGFRVLVVLGVQPTFPRGFSVFRGKTVFYTYFVNFCPFSDHFAVGYVMNMFTFDMHPRVYEESTLGEAQT